jgi:pyruvate,water dikinase
MNQAPHILPLADCHDVKLVGGKAINLAILLAEGFPVPDGFVVTTAGYRHARALGSGLPADLAAEIVAAYHAIGSPTVAVRSSATAEDMAGASMAGQYETFLDIQGEAALLDAVGRCWASLNTDRVRAYLAEQQIDHAQVAMGVVVQMLVPADVAGVLFTENPRLGARGEMLIEASWGLGEAVVSGIVQPDTLVLDRATGAVKQVTIADKQVWVKPGTHGTQPVAADRRQKPCLNSRNVRDLWRLGLRVMEHFGKPQDLEWAIYNGTLYLLQSRAITTLEDAEAYAQCLQHTREQLAAAKSAGRGNWVRHNISETLPQPTPLTWSVIRRFMSGDGGFGAMYRAIGFVPAPTVCRDGFLDLIAGRIYMDLARAGEMFFEKFPFCYDLDLLRTNPDAAQGPPTIPGGSLLTQFRIGRKLTKMNAQLETLAADYDQKLDTEWIPAFTEWIAREKQRDLRALSTAQWLELWRERERRVMDEFAPQSLMPSLISGMALAQLRAFLAENFWAEDPDQLVNLLASAAPPDRTVRATAALFDIAEGRGTLEAWLKDNGHRAPEEFDLATPRWCERPDAVKAMLAHLHGSTSALELHERRATMARQRIAELSAQLSATDRAEFTRRLALVHRYLPYRENGKYYLMLGYDLLRDLAREAGRRLELDLPEDVFLLSFEELHDALGTGFAPLYLIEQRRLTRAAEARVSLPFVITEADLPTLGNPPPLAGGNRLAAFPISAGQCQGPARVVFKPEEAGDLGSGYVLVCPSTDPSWTPLFVKAAGLVMERGGTLSHGAVVAREMGIPAVVLDGATRLFQDAEPITVDGHNGAVLRATATEPAVAAAPEPTDTRVPCEQVPPPAGQRERQSATLRNVFLAVWGVYLLAVFLLPDAWVKQPTFHALDMLLLPLVAAVGRAGTVALVSAVLAAVTMIGQRLLTDNRRLLLAKERANRLRQEALKLPADAPRRQALLALAGPVGTRVMMAAFVPLAVILGPMVMSFLWFPERIDPASWNPQPGATVFVTATVDGEYLKPVTLSVHPALTLDATTPVAQSLPPLRPALERLLAKWQQPSPLPDNLPWELQETVKLIHEQRVSELSTYLKGRIPPQTLSWTIRTPKNTGGCFAVQLHTEGAPAVTTRAVLGDRHAPELKEDLGDGKGPVQLVRSLDPEAPLPLVKVTYKEQKKEGADVFWAPFQRWGWKRDFGWLWTYIIAYVPLMFFWRWALRIP